MKTNLALESYHRRLQSETIGWRIEVERRVRAEGEVVGHGGLKMWMGSWELVRSRAPDTSKPIWDLPSSIVHGTLRETYFDIPSVCRKN